MFLQPVKYHFSEHYPESFLEILPPSGSNSHKFVRTRTIKKVKTKPDVNSATHRFKKQNTKSFHGSSCLGTAWSEITVIYVCPTLSS